MAVGRITGPLLAKNLLRDGVDLAFENDLLYLDVTTGRIGIKTSSPDYTLDVNGDTNVLSLRVVTTSTLGTLTVQPSATGTIVQETSGDIFIGAPVENKIRLQNDTIVKGNLHATGNITANGSVQIGNITGSDTLSLYADIVSNITPQSPSQYDLGAEGLSWANAYVDNVIAGALTAPKGQDVNVTPGLGNTINLNGNVRIWGKNPLGTYPIIQNTLYVNMDGSDTNDGGGMDPTRACRTITGALKSPLYQPGTSIKVAAGRYLEDNPLILKPYTSVIGSDLRTTVIEPINKTQDLFWLDSGNYLAQMLFVNGQSGLLPGNGYRNGFNRGAYATAFRPSFGTRPKIDLYHSPYVQNCTNQSGPWLNDGTMFLPNQTVQIPEAVGTATWIANTTTMLVYLEEGELKLGQSINIGPTKPGYVNARTLLLANKAFFQEQVVAYIDQKYEYFGYDEVKCARDTGLVIDSLVTDLVFGTNGYTQSNFAGLQYWNQDGYTGSISTEITTTTNAIEYVSELAQQIVQNITTGTRYQSTATQVTGTPATVTQANTIQSNFDIIVNILTTGTAGVSDIIIPNGLDPVSSGAQNAATLLQANKAYIQAEAVAFVEATKTPGFVYDPVKCYRDVGYMIDSVTFDVLYGGNRQSVQSGVFYYTFDEDSTAIPREIPQTTAAYYRIREIIQDIITNQEIVKSQGNLSEQVTNLPASSAAPATALREMVDLITEIIGAGPDASLEPQPVGLTKSADLNILRAANIIKANKSFIIDEVIGFVEARYNDGFAYNQPKCFRDTGLIVDSIANDLLFDGETQSAFSGLQYWNQDGYLGILETEATATVLALDYLSDICTQIVVNGTGTRYQSTVTQVIGTTATIFEQTIIDNEFSVITNIISNGTLGVSDIIVPNGTASTTATVLAAVDTLQANKTYIQTEAVSYINSIYKIFDTVKCERDTGLIVDAITQDLLFSTSSQSTFAGLQYWNQREYTTGIADEISTTTSAISFIKTLSQEIVVNFTGGTRYSTGTQVTALPAATPAEATIIGDDFDVILDIINTGTIGVSDLIIPNGLTPSPDPDVVYAYDLLQANRTFIQQEAVAFVEATKDLGYIYDQNEFNKTVGEIVDAISIDLLYGGNRQAVQAGVYFYDFTGDSAIAGEIQNTLEAYDRLRELLPFVIQGISYPTPAQLVIPQIVTGNIGSATESSFATANIDLIANIIESGPSVVTSRPPLNITPSTSTNVQNAITLLAANKGWLVAEVIAYISNPTGFTYDQNAFYENIGDIIDSICFDLKHGGNRQAVQSGVYFYNFEGSTAIPNEIPQTTAAYNHLRNILDSIVSNQLITPSSGNTATQVLLSSTATNAEITELYSKVNLITEIILNGPTAAPAKAPIALNASTSTTVQAAYDLLIANKNFIQNEIIAFTNQFDTGFVYNRAKCRRDIGIILENIAYDIAFGGNEKSVLSGLSYWEGVTSVISNEITETADAFDYLAQLAQDVIANVTATNLLNTYQTAPQVINTALVGGEVAGPVLTKLIGIINDIIVNGPDVAPTSQTGNGPDWGSVSAEVLLESNRQFIQNEVIAWINANYPDLEYREDKCYRDTGLIIDAVAQDIVLNANAKSIEAAVTYWTGNESVLENASYGKKNQVEETLAAINHAKDVALQVITNTTITTTSFVFNPDKCYRDTGLIVDGIAQDLLFGGNSQSTFAGIQYWNHGTYVDDIPDQIFTTTAAINYVSDLAQKIVQNITTGVRYQNTVTQNTALPAATITEAGIVAKNFSTITNIIVNGVEGVTNAIIPNNLSASGSVNVNRAYNLLQANKEYLQAEAIAFVEATKSFDYDPVKCERDTGLIVDSIALDLAYPSTYLSQSTFAGLQYWNQTGYVDLIEGEVTTTTNAIAFLNSLAQLIVQNNTGGVRYQSTVTQFVGTLSATISEVTDINTEFETITDIITGGTAGVSDIIVPNSVTPSTSTSVITAYELLQANRDYLVAETIAYVEASKAPEFVYDPILCARDVGYMIDSVSFDILHGGNRQAVQSGVYYYNFSGSTTIPGEIAQTVAAFEFVKALSQQLVQNITITPLQTAVAQDTSLPPADGKVVKDISDRVQRIIRIIEGGPEVIDVKEPISLTQASDIEFRKAAAILEANKDFIKAETIAYINYKLVFQYDPDICRRDVSYIVDSVSFDLLYGGNRQSIQSGVYYWGYSDVSTSLPNEQQASTQAYQFMKGLMTDIVSGLPRETTFQNTVTQVVSASTATQIEITAISNNIDLITKIINEGPDSAPPRTPIGLVESDNRFVRNAVNLLAANRQFIQAEVIAFVDETLTNNEQVILPFYDKGENATLSLLRNFDIITNIIENGPGVAPIKSDGNGIFVKTGLSPDDVKDAPKITAITTVSTNVYQVDINQSTIGFGDAQSLYFGQTLVFPAKDEDVPDRWQQRRVNPIGSMGGSLVDGNDISERSPINSFVYDAYTQVNQGGQGIKITNNGYAQLVSVFTIFCSNAVTVDNGGICSITNSNSNFGDICLTAKGYGKRDFSGYIANEPVLPFFPNGVYPQQAQVVVYVPDPDLRPHISLVMEVEPPEGYINNQGLPGFLSGQATKDFLNTGTIDITEVDTTNFVVGQAFYIIDQFGRQVDDNNQPYVRPGTIVADVNYQTITLNFPLNSGGGEFGNTNYFNLYSCGNAYYTVLSSVLSPDPIPPGTSLLPNQQNEQEAIAIDYLETIVEKVVDNAVFTATTTATQVFDLTQAGGTGALSFIGERLDIIQDILVNGPNAAPDEVVNIGPLPSGAGSAASLLRKNRRFIQEEVTAFVDQQFFSFSYDQVKCARDTGLIVDAIAQDLLFLDNSQSTFAGLQYWNQHGYTGSIGSEITTTTNAINYIKGVAQQVVQCNVVTGLSSATQVITPTFATPAEATSVGDKFDIILNILNTGTTGVTDIIVPNNITSSTNINIVRAYNLLQANKTFIQEEAIAWVEANKAPGFEYNTSTCYRDVGYIVDSVSFDILWGGNRQSVQSGVYYYSYNSTSTAVPGEVTQTIDAYSYLATLTQKLILGEPITTLQSTVPQVSGTTATVAEVNITFNSLANITKIINQGPEAVFVGTPLPTTPSPDVAAQNSANMIATNRDFIVAETIAYIANEFPSFTYDQVKCARDTGLIIDAIAQDIFFASSSQSTFAGLQYWNQAGYIGTIAGELTTTTNAVNYINSLAQKIIQNDISGTRYQDIVEQNTALPAATGAEATVIDTNFDLIVEIINTGTSGVTDIIVPNSLVAGTGATKRAFDLLLANKAYIQAEAIAFVEATKTPGFVYDPALCRRDVGYMIDAVAIDLLYGGNRQSVQAGVYYYSFNANSSAVPGEREETVAAYNYIRSILPDIILGNAITPLQGLEPQVTSGTYGNASQAEYAQSKIDIINDIIEYGPRAIDNRRPIDLDRSINPNVVNAAKLIDANREFLVAETIAYINRKYNTYNREKCKRDVGLLVDALTYDLERGGNYNAVIAGKSYYAQAGTFHLVQLEENVSDPGLFPDRAIVTFYQRSYMSASGYLFEYVGAGTNYGALPQRGVKDPVQSKETVQLNNGKVFFTSTDQNGDFRIGTGLVISQATGVLSGRTFTKSLFANLTPFILAIEG